MTSFCCPTVRSSGDCWDWCHCAILSRSRADTIARAAPWRGHAGHHCSAPRCTILYTAPYSGSPSAVGWLLQVLGAGAGDGISGGENRDAHLISRPSTISAPSHLSGPDNSHHRQHVRGKLSTVSGRKYVRISQHSTHTESSVELHHRNS